LRSTESAEKFSGEGRIEKRQKIVKRPKNSTIKPLPGGGATEKRPKNSKRKTKNSTFKPLSNIFHV